MQAANKDKDKKEEQEDLDDLSFLRDMRQTIQKDASIRNSLYDVFLKRVRKNFHLIFNFTPSGYNFREKMDRHKNLMLNSQMIWI